MLDFFISTVLFAVILFIAWSLHKFGVQWLYARSDERAREQLTILRTGHVWTMLTVVYGGFWALIFFIFAVVATMHILHGDPTEAIRLLLVFTPGLILLTVGAFLCLTFLVSKAISLEE